MARDQRNYDIQSPAQLPETAHAHEPKHTLAA